MPIRLTCPTQTENKHLQGINQLEDRKNPVDWELSELHFAEGMLISLEALEIFSQTLLERMPGFKSE